MNAGVGNKTLAALLILIVSFFPELISAKHIQMSVIHHSK